MAFEFAYRRAEERFAIHEAHDVSFGDKRRVVDVVDVSVSGAAIRWGVSRPAVGEPITLHLSDVGPLPAVVRRWIGDVGVGVGFDGLAPELERLLVAKIFTHAYENLGKASSTAGVNRGIWRRLAGSPAVVSAPDWSMLPARAPIPEPHGVRPDLTVAPRLAYPRLTLRGATARVA
jgi:hypothetical protein